MRSAVSTLRPRSLRKPSAPGGADLATHGSRGNARQKKAMQEKEGPARRASHLRNNDRGARESRKRGGGGGGGGVWGYPTEDRVSHAAQLGETKATVKGNDDRGKKYLSFLSGIPEKHGSKVKHNVRGEEESPRVDGRGVNAEKDLYLGADAFDGDHHRGGKKDRALRATLLTE